LIFAEIERGHRGNRKDTAPAATQPRSAVNPPCWADHPYQGWRHGDVLK
jgi:hypothetical protein